MTTNEKVVSWISENVRKYFSDDISLVVLFGSYVNGTASEKSDVDCFFVPKTEDAYKFARTFVIDGVGYDIWPMEWNKIERMSDLEEPYLTLLGDSRIIFASGRDERERFNELKDKMLRNLSSDEKTGDVAKHFLRAAVGLYRRALGSRDVNQVRTCTGYTLLMLGESVTRYNHTYFKKGKKRQEEEIARIRTLPLEFLDIYRSVIREKDTERQKELLGSLVEYAKKHIKCTEEFNYDAEYSERAVPADAVPDFRVVADRYEEMCSSFRSIETACAAGDYVAAYLTAAALQYDLDKLCISNGLPLYNLMECFDAKDLTKLSKVSVEADKDIRNRILEADIALNEYETFEEFAEIAKEEFLAEKRL